MVAFLTPAPPAQLYTPGTNASGTAAVAVSALLADLTPEVP